MAYLQSVVRRRAAGEVMTGGGRRRGSPPKLSKHRPPSKTTMDAFMGQAVRKPQSVAEPDRERGTGGAKALEGAGAGRQRGSPGSRECTGTGPGSTAASGGAGGGSKSRGSPGPLHTASPEQKGKIPEGKEVDRAESARSGKTAAPPDCPKPPMDAQGLPGDELGGSKNTPGQAKAEHKAQQPLFKATRRRENDSDQSEEEMDGESGGDCPSLKKSCKNDTPPDRITDIPNQQLDSAGDAGPRKSWEALLGDDINEDGLRAFFQAIPTYQDMEELFNKKLEDQAVKLGQLVKEQMIPIQEALLSLTQKMDVLEQQGVQAQKQIAELRETTKIHQCNLMDVQLQLLDLENRGRRRNIRIRGLPENITQEALKDQITAIFNHYLGRAATDVIVIDRLHRVMNRKPNAGNRPRDVLCRLHYSADKEAIMRETWDKGPFLLNGTQIMLLHDLAGKTLAMRKILKPATDLAKQKGASYRWGHPMSLVVKFRGNMFVLRDPEQLGDFFKFLDAQPVNVEDWTQILMRSV